MMRTSPRCLRENTQSSDESVHSVIWPKCLKTDFVRKLRIEAGAALAVSEFNHDSDKTVSETAAALGFRRGKPLMKLTQVRGAAR